MIGIVRNGKWFINKLYFIKLITSLQSYDGIEPNIRIYKTEVQFLRTPTKLINNDSFYISGYHWSKNLDLNNYSTNMTLKVKIRLIDKLNIDVIE